MALRITHACDYAIRAMLLIASLPEGAVTMSEEVALAEKIPASFAAKILRKLVRNGLLRSSRGPTGASPSRDRPRRSRS